MFLKIPKCEQPKLGSPKRELWIDDQWYNIYFDENPMVINLAGRDRKIFLQKADMDVEIGNVPRRDLCLGAVDLYLSVKNSSKSRYQDPIFLDSKPQLVSIGNKDHVFEFCNLFRSVLINGQRFPVSFGGENSIIIYVGGVDYHVWFGHLPIGAEKWIGKPMPSFEQAFHKDSLIEMVQD